MTAAIEFSRVLPADAAAIFVGFLPQIERGLRNGNVTPDALLELILAGHRLLWVAHEGDDVIAAVVLSVRDEHGRRVLYVDLCAGSDLDSWVGPLETLLREYGDLVGADAIGCECRPGLARRLARRGWREVQHVMELR